MRLTGLTLKVLLLQLTSDPASGRGTGGTPVAGGEVRPAA
jgi:hypothetical protein